MDSTNPLYVDNTSLQNQGVFSGDGNKYRFAFELWSGDMVPGGTPNDPTQMEETYYCFSVGNIDDPNYYPMDRKIRCWIKKEVFTTRTVQDNRFEIFSYKEGPIVIFYGELAAGVILPSYIASTNGMWGIEGAFGVTDTDVVFDVDKISVYNNARDIFLASGGRESCALLHTGIINLEDDEIHSIQEEDNLVYTNRTTDDTTFSLIPKTSLGDSTILTSLQITVPTNFIVNDDRIKVENVTDGSLSSPELSTQEGVFSTSIDIQPTGTEDIAEGSGPNQYLSIEVDPLNNTLVSAEQTSTFNTLVYPTNFLGTLTSGDEAILYITLKENTGAFTGSLHHTTSTIPDNTESQISIWLCSVKFDGTRYSLKNADAKYSALLKGGRLILSTPMSFEELEPDVFEEIRNLLLDDKTIDLNKAEHQEALKLILGFDVAGEEIEGEPGPVTPVQFPASFINAQYYPSVATGGVDNTSLGVVRVPKSDADKPLMVTLSGVNELPVGDKNRIYARPENNEWGLYELEGLELVTPEEGPKKLRLNASLPDGTADGDLLIWNAIGGEDGDGAWESTTATEKDIVTNIVFSNGKLTVTKEKIRCIAVANTTVYDDVFSTIEGAGKVLSTKVDHSHQ